MVEDISYMVSVNLEEIPRPARYIRTLLAWVRSCLSTNGVRASRQATNRKGTKTQGSQTH